VQVEGGPLGDQHAVVGERVRADALVAERGEGERLGDRAAAGRGGERVDPPEVGEVGRVVAGVPDHVVVGGAGQQVAGGGVHVVLVGRRDDACQLGVQRADLGLDLRAESLQGRADPQERAPHPVRDLPADADRGARVGAPGQMPAERDDHPARRGVGLAPERGGRAAADRHRGGGRGGAGQQGAAGEEQGVPLGDAQPGGKPVRQAHARDVGRHGLTVSSGLPALILPPETAPAAPFPADSGDTT